MKRELWTDRNNQLKDKLEYSSDGGATWTAIDLTAATGLTLQIYDDPDDPLLEIDGLGEFTVDASGNATWQPGDDELAAAHVGTHNVRWIVATATEPQGVVIEAEPVVIKE